MFLLQLHGWCLDFFFFMIFGQRLHSFIFLPCFLYFLTLSFLLISFSLNPSSLTHFPSIFFFFHSLHSFIRHPSLPFSVPPRFPSSLSLSLYPPSFSTLLQVWVTYPPCVYFSSVLLHIITIFSNSRKLSSSPEKDIKSARCKETGVS